MPLVATKTEAPPRTLSPLVAQCVELAKQAVEDFGEWFEITVTQEELRGWSPETDKEGKPFKVGEKEVKGLSRLETSLRRAGNELDVTINVKSTPGKGGTTVVKFKARERIVKGSDESETGDEDFTTEED